MGTAASGERLTVGEYLMAPETNRRRELAWGVVREPPAPNWDHQFVVGRLFTKLDAHVARLELGNVGVSPIDVILDAERHLVVQPDIVFIAAERSGIIRDRVWGAPDLVVEVLSPESWRYDRGEKRAWYARYGVRELWLVEPQAGTIAVCDLMDGGSEAVEYSGPQMVRSRVLPQLRLRVGSSFDGCGKLRSSAQVCRKTRWRSEIRFGRSGFMARAPLRSQRRRPGLTEHSNAAIVFPATSFARRWFAVRACQTIAPVAVTVQRRCGARCQGGNSRPAVARPADSATRHALVQRRFCKPPLGHAPDPPGSTRACPASVSHSAGYNERMAGSDRMRAARSAVKLTYDDFVHFPDDGKRHELIDGEHHVTPSPNTKHQRISAALLSLIWNWLDRHPVGQVFHAPYDIVLSDVDVVEPDLVYLSNERALQAVTPKHVRGVPDLVVEIASRGTRKRDETIKRRLYEKAGVGEYWVVDQEVETVRVYRREGDRFSRAIELSREEGEMLTTPLIPGLELPLGRIFRE